MKVGSDHNNIHRKVTEKELSTWLKQNVIPHVENRRIWAFYGDLGAGKTTLIKTLCALLGIDKNEVNSPTFALVNTYCTNEREIHHFDFYRIEDEEEAYDIGYDEYFYGTGLCLIEWPEKIESLLPEDTVKVKISPDEDSDCRHYEIQYE